jgi:hypothetical protein
MPSASSNRSATEPTPYELYIRLAELEALWPRGPEVQLGEVVLVCGFQAAELTLRLVDDALGDERVAAFAEQRVKRYVEHLVDGVELTCDLLQRIPAQVLAAPACDGESVIDDASGFRVLGRVAPDLLDASSRRLLHATSRLPFELGIERQLEGARRERGLQACELPARSPDTPAFDYARAVAPESIRKLREAIPSGPEDHLFSTAHQITECWLRIAHQYLSLARSSAEAQHWAQAADAVAAANAVLPLVVDAGQLLDQMVLADYHPLRVRLRDGSGAQSSAARRLGPAVRQVGEALWTAIASANLSVIDILDRPSEHLELYRCLGALKTAGKLAQSFLFSHYLLTLGVLGTHSLGSLGYEIRELAERAAQPLLPEINQAHHDYVMLSNFEHGDRSGSIVYRNELAYGWDPYQSAASASARASCPRSLMANCTTLSVRARTLVERGCACSSTACSAPSARCARAARRRASKATRRWSIGASTRSPTMASRHSLKVARSFCSTLKGASSKPLRTGGRSWWPANGAPQTPDSRRAPRPHSLVRTSQNSRPERASSNGQAPLASDRASDSRRHQSSAIVCEIRGALGNALA